MSTDRENTLPEAAVSPKAPAAKRVSTEVGAFFAAGGIATGIINNGVASFVLLYYNLVLGVPASLVGGALAIALAIDAFTDPTAAYISDNWHSRWGRRHPFMYASILPTVALFYLLWNPPLELLGEAGLFAYVLIITISLRLALTFYEVPSGALLPEMTSDYDERTSLLNFRWSLYFFAANGFTVAIYYFWLRDTPEHPEGLLNAGGYHEMSVVGCLIVLASMLLATTGLHRVIPNLQPPPAKQRFSALRMFRDVRITFADASLAALLLAGVFFASANGMMNALWAYMLTYFWGLDKIQLSILLVAYVLASVVAYMATRGLTAGREKKTIAMGIALASMVIMPGPVLLRLAGWFPANGSEWLFPILLVHGVIEISLYIMFMVMLATMISDMVEHRQLVTGKRNEGVLYSAQTFVVKITSGLGAWFAGMALDVISFPTNVTVDEVPHRTIIDLGLVYAPAVFLLYGLCCLAMKRFRLSRADHHHNLSKLNAPDG